MRRRLGGSRKTRVNSRESGLTTWVRPHHAAPGRRTLTRPTGLSADLQNSDSSNYLLAKYSLPLPHIFDRNIGTEAWISTVRRLGDELSPQPPQAYCEISGDVRVGIKTERGPMCRFWLWCPPPQPPRVEDDDNMAVGWSDNIPFTFFDNIRFYQFNWIDY